MTIPNDRSERMVLVIEDDPDFSDYLGTTLRDHGYQTEVVVDGQEALERARVLKPDGITLDILLPGRTGIAIYRQLRTDAGTSEIPVVIVSGVGTEGKKLDLHRFFNGRAIAPPSSVLQKPVEPEALLRAVDDAINRAS